MYDLKNRLNSVGSQLIVRFGILEEILENYVKACQAKGDNVYGVWMSKEICDAEVQQERIIQQQMCHLGVDVRYIPGKQLGVSFFLKKRLAVSRTLAHAVFVIPPSPPR